VATRVEVARFDHPNRVAGLAVNNDGSLLAAGGINGGLYLWRDPMSILTGHYVEPRRRRAPDPTRQIRLTLVSGRKHRS
jgi:hypothetical protein